MLYHLLFELKEQVGLFNVVRYITFRTAMATLSALLIVLLFGPWTIERLRRLKFGQQIRSDGPESHKAKAGTHRLKLKWILESANSRGNLPSQTPALPLKAF